MWLPHIIDRNCARFPDAVATRDVRREVRWRDLRREVGALAALLCAQVPPGGRVLLLSGNRIELLHAYFACAAAGAVAVPVNPALTQAEIGYILSSVEPACALADSEGRQKLACIDAGLPLLAIEDTACLPAAPDTRWPAGGDLTAPFAILHTSATTGRPKGVVIDQRSIQLNALSWLSDVRPEPGTIFLTGSPLFHGSVVAPLHYLAAGATVCVLDAFTPQACLTALATWRVQHAFLVPSMVRLLLQARGLAATDLTSLQLILHSAAPMPPELAKEATEVLDVPLHTIFGITEGGGAVLSLPPEQQPGPPPVMGATCAGIPMLGTAAKIALPDGTPAGSGEIGELHLAGDGLMRGYWRDPGATAAVLADGWLNTQDLGCLDDQGRIWVVDRRHDLILRGGQNIYPAEIEHVLRQSPLVADVAVVPAPSQSWGQTPVAFVQPSPPRQQLDEADLIQLVDLCGERLAGYKRPSQFLAVDRIPRSPAGKILRQVLRDRAEHLLAGGRSS
jgi:acyl-CoA synthetase (AMP-forming)/AMP-acid ligase II